MSQLVQPGATRRAQLFIFVTILIDMIGIALIMPVMPALLQHVGHVDLARATVIGGWMFAAYSLAQFLCGPLIGNLSDRFGRRPLLLVAIGGLAIDYVFCALAPSIWMLFIGRLIAGICGASYITASAFMTDVTPAEDRARAFGMIGAAFGMGFVIGPAIGGLLGELGPRVPFWAAAALSGANFVFGLFVLPESLAPEKRRAFDWRRCNPLAVLKVFRGYPSVLPLTVVMVMYFFATSSYPTLWSFWGIAQLGWDELTIGITLAMFGATAALFEGVLSGPLVRWVGESRVILMGLVTGTIGAFGFALVTQTWMVAALLVFVALEGLVHPCLNALMTKQVPDDAQGELQGGISSLSNLAMLLASIFYTQIFGWFIRPEAETPMPGAPYMVTGLLLALSLFVFLRVGGWRRGGGLTAGPAAPTVAP
ncbi:TCR/Tet family MFS transporter [Pseudooceanicola sp. C21-150M6]|uniref:TCR/Tet family MFS transporter n=1 Tax=Pseudooceanicola sp. C21-150M6 TaxID=3434355 RepID=UPI003D7FA1D1